MQSVFNMNDNNENLKLKVAMVGLRGVTDGLGGVEKVVREVSLRLVRSGVDVTCYCRPRYNQQTNYQGIRLVNTATLHSKHAETAFYALGSLIRAARSDCDIVHIHALASANLGWIPRWFGGKKVVVSIHGLDWQRAKWGLLARKILQAGERAAVRFSDCVICVSQSLHTYFQMRYLHHRFAYIPNGCDTLPANPVDPPDGLDSKGYFLFMGRLTPEKGVHRLIEAYRMLDTDKKLVIAGPEMHGGDYTRRLHELANGDERIIFTGSITGNRKEQILSHAYLFVLPSELEGLPVALIEAASYGVCPAVSNIPTAVEVLGSAENPTGFIFNPYSTEDLRDVLSASLDQPELVEEFGRKAQQRVVENYNWDEIAHQTLQVYKDIMEGQAI